MDSITIGQIVSAIGSITAIAVFFIAIFKWYKKNITDKFTNVDEKIDEMSDRLENVENYVEKKEKEFLKELGDSKFERGILMEGELSALKLLWSLVDESKIIEKDKIGKSIESIEEYVMKKSH